MCFTKRIIKKYCLHTVSSLLRSSMSSSSSRQTPGLASPAEKTSTSHSESTVSTPVITTET